MQVLTQVHRISAVALAAVYLGLQGFDMHLTAVARAAGFREGNAVAVFFIAQHGWAAMLALKGGLALSTVTIVLLVARRHRVFALGLLVALCLEIGLVLAWNLATFY